jgi:hypothetical protein
MRDARSKTAADRIGLVSKGAEHGRVNTKIAVVDDSGDPANQAMSAGLRA